MSTEAEQESNKALNATVNNVHNNENRMEIFAEEQQELNEDLNTTENNVINNENGMEMFSKEEQELNEALNRKEANEFEKRKKLFNITKFTLPITVFSLTLFLFDIGSDIYTSVRYFQKNEKIYGTLTLICVIVPMIYNFIKRFKKNVKVSIWETYKCCPFHWMWISFYVVFGLEIPHLYCKNIVAAFKYRHISQKPKDKHGLLKQFHATYIEIAYLRLNEAIAEALPQLTLQLYIIAVNPGATMWYQWITVTTSFLGFACTKMTNRKADIIDDKNMQHRESKWGYLIFTLGCTLPVVGRITSMALFMSVWPWWSILLFVLPHWILGTWWYCLKPDEHGCTKDKFAAMTKGFEWIIEPDSIRLKHVIRCTSLYVVENALLLCLWMINACCDSNNRCCNTSHIIIIALGIYLADLFGRFLYYWYCKNRLRFKTNIYKLSEED